MTPEDLVALALRLLDAADRGVSILPPSAQARPLDAGQALAVAGRIEALRRERGETPIGRKIGFTNRNIWPRYGVHAPIWGPVYDTTVVQVPDGLAVHPLAAAVAPLIEPEICLGLAAPVDAGASDPEAVLGSVAWAAPAFEIVDCRYPDWRFAATDAIADQALHRALYVGARSRIPASERRAWAERLSSCRVILSVDGTVREQGRGENALGHPALALAHLARELAAVPGAAALAPGEIVSTGTLTSALAVRSGEHWRAEFDGIALAPLALRFD